MPCKFKWQGIGDWPAGACACGRWEYWGKTRAGAKREWADHHAKTGALVAVGGTDNGS